MCWLFCNSFSFIFSSELFATWILVMNNDDICYISDFKNFTKSIKRIWEYNKFKILIASTFHGWKTFTKYSIKVILISTEFLT